MAEIDTRTFAHVLVSGEFILSAFEQILQMERTKDPLAVAGTNRKRVGLVEAFDEPFSRQQLN